MHRIRLGPSWPLSSKQSAAGQSEGQFDHSHMHPKPTPPLFPPLPAPSDVLQDETRANLITATCASAMASTFIMGAFANMPVALAPGLGLNAYFGELPSAPEALLVCVWVGGGGGCVLTHV